MDVNAVGTKPVAIEPVVTRAYEQGGAALKEEKPVSAPNAGAGEKSTRDGAPPGEEVSKKDADRIVDSLNNTMDKLQTRLGFRIGDDDNRTIIVSIINRETDEVIRQIPSEELLEIQDKMKELTGILLNEKA